MSVKSIFKILLGTVLIVVLSLSLVEIFNMMITSMQIKKISKTAAYQACAMFTQESFQTARFDGQVEDILDSNGDLYCTGNFYKSLGLSSGASSDDIYDALFRGSKEVGTNDFFDFVISDSSMEPYVAPKLLVAGILKDGKCPVTALQFNSTPAKIQENMDMTRANAYYNNKYTPANLGIPYLDKDVCTTMFQWSLTQLLSNCNSNNIWGAGDSVDAKLATDGEPAKMESGGTVETTNLYQSAVYYKGFACYVADTSTSEIGAQARITDISYKTYDLGNSSDRSKFTKDTGTVVQGEDTHLGALKLAPSSKTSDKGVAWDTSYRTGGLQETLENANAVGPLSVDIHGTGAPTNVLSLPSLDKDNALVTVATVEYTVPYQYLGVTPLRTLMSFVWGKEVAGIAGRDGAPNKYTPDKYKDKFDNSAVVEVASNNEDDGWDLSAYYKTDKLQFMLVN